MASAGTLLASPRSALAMECQTVDGSEAFCQRLDSGWKFRPGPTDGVWETWRPEEDSLWQSVALPHCFNATDACDPEKPYFRGQGWYRNEVEVKNPFQGGRMLLHFQGAGQMTTLWVESKLIGTHRGGYDEFVFDLTDALTGLSNRGASSSVRLAVLCDNSPDLDRVPSGLSDFCLYGGLYRHVNLVYVPAVALDAVHVLPTVEADGSARISIKARLYNPSSRTASGTVAILITDASGRSVYEATQPFAQWIGLRELCTCRVGEPQLWSPESPHLYQCRVTISTAAGKAALTERFGIRQVEFVENGPFKLNGKRVLLRGTHRHADHAGTAAAMPDDLVREEIRLIRTMGANFIRLAHYQQDRLVLELCDELGLMVWEEAPWCRAGVGSPAFQQSAKDMLARMIDQHYNHPSIILWGLGNEDDWPGEYPSIDQQTIRKLMIEMRDLAHRLDGSRLTALRRCDFARDIPDVYSPSIWAGWYGHDFRQYEEIVTAEQKRVKRFLHMEWGADSHAGRHVESQNGAASGGVAGERSSTTEPPVSKHGDWSESYACDLFDWHLKTQEKLSWLTGSAQWAFKDFASPLRGDSAIPRINQKGVVERDLTKKESYFVFQSYWASEPMAHIYGHSWPVRWGLLDEPRDVRVYSNCDRAELFLNGRSLGTLQRDSQDFPAAGLRWKVVFTEGLNQLRVRASKGDVTVQDDLELSYQTASWSKPTELRLTENVRQGEVVSVTARIYDAKGVPCLDSRNIVRFSLAGEGRLLDNLGTTRGSRELQLYNGRAEIAVAHKGECTIGITAEGVNPGFLKLI